MRRNLTFVLAILFAAAAFVAGLAWVNEEREIGSASGIKYELAQKKFNELCDNIGRSIENVVGKGKFAELEREWNGRAESFQKERTAPAGIPRNSEEFAFDGRRFARGGKGVKQATERKEKEASQAFNDILSKINFGRGGQIRVERDETLILKPSYGWIWGYMPRVDLEKNAILTVAVKTKRKCHVWLELKDEKDRPLVGEPRFGTRKIPLVFPHTNGKPSLASFDLSKHFVKDIENRTARIIALSDPSGTIEIMRLGFSKDKPKKAKLLETP